MRIVFWTETRPCWHPSGMRAICRLHTGGVVAPLLDHRLMAAMPSAWRGGGPDSESQVSDWGAIMPSAFGSRGPLAMQYLASRASGITRCLEWCRRGPFAAQTACECIREPGGFQAISRWLSEATPPVTMPPTTASRRDASTPPTCQRAISTGTFVIGPSSRCFVRGTAWTARGAEEGRGLCIRRFSSAASTPARWLRR